MPAPEVLSTVVDLVDHDIVSSKQRWWSHTRAQTHNSGVRSRLSDITAPDPEDPELKLPSFNSLLLVILGNALSQISLYIVVSSANAYAEDLGGTATFSGLIIGIPTLFAGVALIPMARYDNGQYKLPMNFAYAAMLLGNILYGLAYHAGYLYLILLGRIVSGFGFTTFMYFKRYCSDPRIVGVRRRTTLASWLVVGQGFGFSAGPFFGGLLYKIGFSNKVFNGFTGPGWVMASAWAMFLTASSFLFEDVLRPPIDLSLDSISQPRTSGETNSVPVLFTQPPPHVVVTSEGTQPVTQRQWGVILTMMWYAMTCFFILGAWESNIPVYTASVFQYNPYHAGNFIALGGVTTFPFLILNVRYSGRIQDRVTLALGSSLGFSGLVLTLAILLADRVTFASFYVCWFLVALGFNLASTCTLSLLSKQLPPTWNGRISLAIQYSNYTGRVTGAVWGGAGVKVGMVNYVALQIGIVGIGALLHSTLWRELKAKTG